MITEALIIGLCIIVGAGIICTTLDKINDTLQRILKRYAALENLGIFPRRRSWADGNADDPFSGKGEDSDG